MRVEGRFTPPAMGYRYQSYPVVGPGSLEVVGDKLRITARKLGMQWLASVLGLVGFMLGGAIMLVAPPLPGKLYLAIWIAPAIAGVAAGHIVGKQRAMKRGPETREIPLSTIIDVNPNRDLVEIVIKTGVFAKSMITFTATITGEVAGLVAALRNQTP